MTETISKGKKIAETLFVETETATKQPFKDFSNNFHVEIVSFFYRLKLELMFFLV